MVHGVTQAKEWRIRVSVYADVSYGGYTESLLLNRSTVRDPKVNTTIYFKASLTEPGCDMISGSGPCVTSTLFM